MPVNYTDGKIYKIEPIGVHSKGEIYIGSTAQKRLCDRWNGHKSNYKAKKGCVSVHRLFDKYGMDQCHIVLIELVSASCRDELTAREGHYIKTLQCVNKNVAGRTATEYRIDNQKHHDEYQRDYKEEHKAEIKEQNKQYRLANQEKIKEQTKQYSLINRERKKQYDKEYYERKKNELTAGIEQEKRMN